MFRGSIPTAIQQILAETVKKWNLKNLYVGCSGNFTVERVLVNFGEYKIYSNDVTLYSAVIGAYYAKQDFHCELKPLEGFEFLADYFKDPAEKLATVLLASRLSDVISTSGQIKTNSYYQRMYNAHKNQFADMHAKTLERIRSLKMDLAGYYNGDVLEFVKTSPKESGFIVYPPFYAGDYTNMFKKLDLLFDWDKPTYNELNDELLSDFYKDVTSKDQWLFGTDTPQPDYQDYLIGIARTTNRGVPLYIYASSGNKRIVTPEQLMEFDKNSRLTPGVEIGEKMTIAELTGGQFRILRSQYMNEKIKPGQETRSYGILVDGVLIGCFAISVAPTKSTLSNDPTTIYMLSDFPVAPTDYPRLSKLVLYGALSREAQLLMERTTSRRIKEVVTTAFTQRPVSMKYRGLFQLLNRHEYKESERDKVYGNRYMLNYYAPVGKWTLDEGLKLWKEKHGQRNQNADENNQD